MNPQASSRRFACWKGVVRHNGRPLLAAIYHGQRDAFHSSASCGGLDIRQHDNAYCTKIMFKIRWFLSKNQGFKSKSWFCIKKQIFITKHNACFFRRCFFSGFWPAGGRLAPENNACFFRRCFFPGFWPALGRLAPENTACFFCRISFFITEHFLL